MALITADRVFETSTTTGTADLVLAGALTGYRAFSAVCANNDTCYYTLWEVDSAGLPTGAWETGLGTWVTGGTLQRTTVHASSAANAKVTLAAGTKRVALGATAAALGIYAPLASPTFTGTPAAPTAAAGTNTTQLATTAHVFAERANSATLTNKTLTTPVLSGTASGTTAGRLGYSSGEMTWGDGSVQQAVGYKNIPQITKVADGAPTTGADLTYAGKHIYHTSTAGTFTIPANASVAYPVGTALTFVNGNGAGNLTIAITTDTMRLAGAGTTGSRTLAANGVATAVKVSSTEWIISGTNLT